MNCPKCRQPLRLERQALFCDNCGWLHRVAPPGISPVNARFQGFGRKTLAGEARRGVFNA